MVFCRQKKREKDDQSEFERYKYMYDGQQSALEGPVFDSDQEADALNLAQWPNRLVKPLEVRADLRWPQYWRRLRGRQK